MAGIVARMTDTVAQDTGRLARSATGEGRKMLGRARRTRRRLEREVRGLRACWAGRLHALAHAIEPGGDGRVSDQVLAQRVRSRLGPLYRRYDVPRFHVVVVDGVVSLHGVVDTTDDARDFEDAVSRMPGVRGVRSYLFTGLVPGETRPSEGGAGPSTARKELFGVVRALDVGDDEDVERLVRSVMGSFADLLPEDERAHVLGHLPADVRELLTVPRRIGHPERPSTELELYGEVADCCGRSIGTAEQATRAVLDELRELVPEEVADVRAVLPKQLKTLWDHPTAA